jgi:glycosyltransferase involved in cell wall biosynthesis
VIAIDDGVAGPLAGLRNLRVVHNSVDLDAFGKGDGAAVRRELGIPLSAPVAGMVGRVRADEGSLDFLRAAALLQSGVQVFRCSGVRENSPGCLNAQAPERQSPYFLLVGGGTRPAAFFRTPKGRLLLAAGIIRDELADAQALAKRLNLQNVRFVPFRKDVADIYAALDVVVTGGEAGIGRQALEAAAAGRPLVAASRRPVPDLVVEGETGHVVSPGDVPALAARLDALFRDPVRRPTMGAAARRLAAGRFHPTANAEQIMAIYEEVLR